MDRPLRGMGVEEHERLQHEHLLMYHLGWCKELRDATLDVLSGPEREAARKSFTRADAMKAREWYEARAKLQQHGQIHAWAVSARHGLPLRYQAEGRQIVDSFIHGGLWQCWRPWAGVWTPCSNCGSEFRNPYVYRKHLPCGQNEAQPHGC